MVPDAGIGTLAFHKEEAVGLGPATGIGTLASGSSVARKVRARRLAEEDEQTRRRVDEVGASAAVPSERLTAAERLDRVRERVRGRIAERSV